MKRFSTRRLCVLAMLMALYIVLIKLLGVMVTPTMRVSFGYLPIALCGMLFGPVPAALCAAAGDLLGAVLFPQGALFPGYTLTAALMGAIYGLTLQKGGEKQLARVFLAQALVAVICNIVLNTVWSYCITGAGALAGIPTRVLKNVIQYPVDVLLLLALAKIKKPLEAMNL